MLSDIPQTLLSVMAAFLFFLAGLFCGVDMGEKAVAERVCGSPVVVIEDNIYCAIDEHTIKMLVPAREQK